MLSDTLQCCQKRMNLINDTTRCTIVPMYHCTSQHVVPAIPAYHWISQHSSTSVPLYQPSQSYQCTNGPANALQTVYQPYQCTNGPANTFLPVLPVYQPSSLRMDHCTSHNKCIGLQDSSVCQPLPVNPVYGFTSPTGVPAGTSLSTVLFDKTSQVACMIPQTWTCTVLLVVLLPCCFALLSH